MCVFFFYASSSCFPLVFPISVNYNHVCCCWIQKHFLHLPHPIHQQTLISKYISHLPISLHLLGNSLNPGHYYLSLGIFTSKGDWIWPLLTLILDTSLASYVYTGFPSCLHMIYDYLTAWVTQPLPTCLHTCCLLWLLTMLQSFQFVSVIWTHYILSYFMSLANDILCWFLSSMIFFIL